MPVRQPWLSWPRVHVLAESIVSWQGLPPLLARSLPKGSRGCVLAAGMGGAIHGKAPAEAVSSATTAMTTDAFIATPSPISPCQAPRLTLELKAYIGTRIRRLQSERGAKSEAQKGASFFLAF